MSEKEMAGDSSSSELTADEDDWGSIATVKIDIDGDIYAELKYLHGLLKKDKRVIEFAAPTDPINHILSGFADGSRPFW